MIIKVFFLLKQHKFLLVSGVRSYETDRVPGERALATQCGPSKISARVTKNSRCGSF